MHADEPRPRSRFRRGDLVRYHDLDGNRPCLAFAVAEVLEDHDGSGYVRVRWLGDMPSPHTPRVGRYRADRFAHVAVGPRHDPPRPEYAMAS